MLAMQVKNHWDGGIPAALKDHALIPISGGLASAQHCEDRVLIRSCDLRHFSLATAPADLLARLAALGCLVTDDPRCDRLRVLTDPASGEPVWKAASKARVLAALHALPEQKLLSDLAALTRAADTGAGTNARDGGQDDGEGAAHIRTVRAAVADATMALHADLKLRDGFLARLPLFTLAAGGHGPAEDAWFAPDAEWEAMLRPCAGLLPQPLLASAQVMAYA